MGNSLTGYNIISTSDQTLYYKDITIKDVKIKTWQRQWQWPWQYGVKENFYSIHNLENDNEVLDVAEHNYKDKQPVIWWPNKCAINQIWRKHDNHFETGKQFQNNNKSICYFLCYDPTTEGFYISSNEKGVYKVLTKEK